MDASGSHEANRSYYDAFAGGYERVRGVNDPGGYHELLDALEAGLVARYAVEKEVLEVGCGTGLVLERITRFARHARGADLSPNMLALAAARGLDVIEASATKLPFPDATFDVVCSFKVLAHVPQIETALAEMARVTRPGGYVIAEFYNPHSLRSLAKRLGPQRAVAPGTHEGNVFTRYDSPSRARALAPMGCRLVDSRGVRILVPTGAVMRVPVVRTLLRRAEVALCDTWVKRWAGFWIAVYRKE